MNDQISFSRYKYKEIKYTLYLRYKCKGIDVVVWTTFNFSSAPAGVRIWLNLGMAVIWRGKWLAPFTQYTARKLDINFSKINLKQFWWLLKECVVKRRMYRVTREEMKKKWSKEHIIATCGRFILSFQSLVEAHS